MRKLLAAIAATLLLGCSPAEELLVPLTLCLSAPSGAFPTTTKVSSDEFSAVLAATLPPEAADVTLQSETKAARTYSATVGQTVTVAIDAYIVSGGWAGYRVAPSLASSLQSRPTYTVAGRIAVSGDGGTYPLDAAWDCAALLFPADGVASVKVSSSSSGLDDITSHLTRVADLSVIYLRGGPWTTSRPFTVIVEPKDDLGYEPATFTFTSLSPGRWYYLSPESVKVASGSFSIIFPDWSAGN